MTSDPKLKQNNHAHHSVWLVPAAPLRERLRSSIRNLAAEFDAVEFEPHVTIYSGASDDAEMRDLTRKIAAQFPPCELKVQNLDYSSQYTKTLFIQFDESIAARRIHEALKAGCAQTSDYVLNPHLSLLYKTMPRDIQAKISKTLQVPEGAYVFDQLRVIETEIPLSRPEQIANWRTVVECPLGLS